MDSIKLKHENKEDMSHETEPMDSPFNHEREKILLGLELAIQDISHRLEAYGGKLRAIELLTAYLSVFPIRDVDRMDRLNEIPYEIDGVHFLIKEDGSINGARKILEALDRDITTFLYDLPDEPVEYLAPFFPVESDTKWYTKWKGRPKTEIDVDLVKLLEGLDYL